MAEETLSCASCGLAYAPGAAFCSGCGSELTLAPAVTQTLVASGEAVTNCPSCGARMRPEDQFCGGCGEVRPMSGSGSGSTSRSTVWDAILARVTRATKGEFEVIKEIGRGAMGAVYLANDIALGRRVAIKVIAPQLLADENMVERFRLEARTVASLRHPHIVTIHAVRSRDDLHYFVMAFVEGCSLRSIVKTHGQLPIPIIQALLFQVGGALAYAHRKGGGVVHRDVKPANIMIDIEGNAFLTDFGISKVAESSGLTLTGTGLIIGTPEYMSPEQCMGISPTGAGDQYSLGVVAYEMLCGDAPFTGTQYSVLLAHGSKEPEPIEKLRPDCPSEVREAVMRMLAKAPEDRFPNLDDAVVALGGAPLGPADPVRAEIVALIPEHVDEKAEPDAGSAPTTGPEASVESEAPTAVYIAKVPEWLAPGESFDLRAHVETAGGSKLVESEIEWSTSDPSIATVENGRVIALSPGVVTIHAKAGGVHTSLTLGVSLPVPVEIVVEPSSVQIAPGKKVALKAVARDRRGEPVECDFLWSGVGAEVATVSATGEVTAHSSGKAKVTVETGDIRTAVEIKVRPVRKGATVAGAPTFKIAQTSDGEGIPQRWRRPAAGAVSVLILGALVWVFRDQLPLGLSEPSAGPAAELSTTPDGPDSGSAAFSVAAVTVTMDSPRDVILPGDTVRLASSAVNEEGDPVFGGPVSWSVDDSGVASVDAEGLVTAREAGRTRVYAAVGGFREFVEIVVSAPEPVPTQVAASPVPAATDPVTAPANDAADDPAPDPAITQPVTIPSEPPPVVASSILVILGTLVMREEATQEIELTIRDTAGGSISDFDDVSIRSSDPSVASVSGRRVRAVRAGSAYVIAAIDEVSDSVLVTVEALVARVEIQGGDLSLTVGSTVALTAVVRGSSQQLLVDRAVRWRSLSPDITAVNAVTGEATANAPGSAIIVATSEGVEGRVTATVAQPAAPEPEPEPEEETPAPLTAAQITTEVNRFISLLNDGNDDQIRALFGSAASSSENEDLLDKMGERNFAAELGSVAEPTAGDNQTTVAFQVTISYRSGFGGTREETGNLTATFVLGPTDWQIESYTVVLGAGF